MSTRKPKPTPKPEPPTTTSVDMPNEDWQHLLQFAGVGAQKLIDNIVQKSNQLTEAITAKLPKPDKPE